MTSNGSLRIWLQSMPMSRNPYWMSSCTITSSRRMSEQKALSCLPCLCKPQRHFVSLAL